MYAHAAAPVKVSAAAAREHVAHLVRIGELTPGQVAVIECFSTDLTPQLFEDGSTCMQPCRLTACRGCPVPVCWVPPRFLAARFAELDTSLYLHERHVRPLDLWGSCFCFLLIVLQLSLRCTPGGSAIDMVVHEVLGHFAGSEGVAWVYSSPCCAAFRFHAPAPPCTAPNMRTSRSADIPIR